MLASKSNNRSGGLTSKTCKIQIITKNMAKALKTTLIFKIRLTCQVLWMLPNTDKTVCTN